MENIFNDRSMTMKFYILKVHDILGNMQKMRGVHNLGAEKSAYLRYHRKKNTVQTDTISPSILQVQGSFYVEGIFFINIKHYFQIVVDSECFQKCSQAFYSVLCVQMLVRNAEYTRSIIANMVFNLVNLVILLLVGDESIQNQYSQFIVGTYTMSIHLN